MAEKIEYGNVLNLGDHNQVGDVKQTITYGKSFVTELNEVLSELAAVINGLVESGEDRIYPREKCLQLQEIVVNLGYTLNHEEILPLLKGLVRQMKGGRFNLNDRERIKTLLIFLITLGYWQGSYQIKQNKLYKILIKLQDEPAALLLFNLRAGHDLTFRMAGPVLLKHLIRSDYTPLAGEKILLCGIYHHCKGQECSQPEDVFKHLVENFTEIDILEKERPDFFTGLRRRPAIYCGKCLTESLFQCQAARKVFEVMMTDD